MKKLQMLVMTTAGLLMVSGTAMAQAAPPTSVPIPAVWALMAAGVGAIYLFRRK